MIQSSAIQGRRLGTTILIEAEGLSPSDPLVQGAQELKELGLNKVPPNYEVFDRLTKSLYKTLSAKSFPLRSIRFNGNTVNLNAHLEYQDFMASLQKP